MTPKAQRIAIAEACGWSESGWPPGNWYPIDSRTKMFPVKIEQDLNAMHEAEKALNDWSKYVCFVAKVIAGDTRPRVSGNHYNVASSALLHATAAQRAEAFLRTIGKWKDDINA